RGYAMVFGEREVDVNTIAAPVFDRTTGLAAILGLQGPAARLEDPTRHLRILLEAADALTRALGGGDPDQPAGAPAGGRSALQRSDQAASALAGGGRSALQRSH